METQRPCNDWQDLMVDALGGELKPSLEAPFRRHMEECVQCGPLWRDYLAVQRASRVWEESLGLRPQSSERILRFAQSKAPRRESTPKPARASRGWAWLFGPSAVAFATLCLAVGFSFLAHRMRQQDTVPTTSAPAPTPVRFEAPVPPTAGDTEKKIDAFDASVAPARGNHREKITFEAPRPVPQKALSAPAASEAPTRKIPLLEKSATSGAAAQDSLMQPEATQFKPEPQPRDTKGVSKDEGAIPEGAAPIAVPPSPIKENRDLKSDFGGGMQEVGEDKLRLRNADDASSPKKKPSMLGEPRVEAESRPQAEEAENQEALIRSAKAKIEKDECEGALVELQRAESLGRNAEVEKLSRLCREKLRSTAIQKTRNVETTTQEPTTAK